MWELGAFPSVRRLPTCCVAFASEGQNRDRATAFHLASRATALEVEMADLFRAMWVPPHLPRRNTVRAALQSDSRGSALRLGEYALTAATRSPSA